MLLKGRGGAKLAGGERYIGRIIRIGSFSALRMLSMNLSRVFLVRIVAAFGTFAIAAFGIGLRLRIFVLILGFGLADATSVVVGQNLGAGQEQRAEQSAWISTVFFGLFVVLISIIFLVIPRAIIGVFNTHPDVVGMGSRYLLFFVPALLMLNFGIVLGRAIDGAGDTMATMVVTTVTLIVVGVPLAWWFSRLWGSDGLWVGMTIADVLQGIGMIVLFRLGRWKRKKV